MPLVHLSPKDSFHTRCHPWATSLNWYDRMCCTNVALGLMLVRCIAPFTRGVLGSSCQRLTCSRIASSVLANGPFFPSLVVLKNQRIPFHKFPSNVSNAKPAYRKKYSSHLV